MTELTLDIVENLMRERQDNCDSCNGTGKVLIPVWKSVEDQLAHIGGEDIEPLYTIEDGCGVCGVSYIGRMV